MSITIGRLEIYKLVRHPMTWGLLSISIGLLSLVYYRLCVDYLHLAHRALHQRDIYPSLSIDVFKPLCSWTIVVLALIFPLFTTNAFSQEYRHNTFTLWAMSPLPARTIVFAKAKSLLFILLVMISVLILLISSLAFDAPLSYKMIASMLLGVALIGCCFLSFGLFISSIIPNPLFAMGITFLGNLGWMLLEWINPFPSSWTLAKELSLLGHCYHFLNGILYSPDIIYFLIFTGFWLTLSVQVVNHKMTRSL